MSTKKKNAISDKAALESQISAAHYIMSLTGKELIDFAGELLVSKGSSYIDVEKLGLLMDVVKDWPMDVASLVGLQFGISRLTDYVAFLELNKANK